MRVTESPLRSQLLRKLRRRVWWAQRLRVRDIHVTLLYAGIVGVLGGLSSWAYREAIHVVQWLFSRQ